MNVNPTAFERAVAALPLDPPVPEPITKTLKLLYAILERDDDWSGGCYMVTAVSHILLNEQGIASTPCIGDAACDRGPFDHAWLEIEGAVFDLPLQYPLDPVLKMPAVIGGFHFGGQASRVLYGTDSRSYGKIAVGDGARGMIQALSLSQYLSGAESHGLDLWEMVVVLGKGLRLNLDKATLVNKYLTTRWTYRNAVQVPKALTRGWSSLH